LQLNRKNSEIKSHLLAARIPRKRTLAQHSLAWTCVGCN